jgi:hypothetical protein
MDSCPDAALTNPNLCDALCVSERGLQADYRRLFGEVLSTTLTAKGTE